MDDVDCIIEDEVLPRRGLTYAILLSLLVFNDRDNAEKLTVVLYGRWPNVVLAGDRAPALSLTMGYSLPPRLCTCCVYLEVWKPCP